MHSPSFSLGRANTLIRSVFFLFVCLFCDPLFPSFLPSFFRIIGVCIYYCSLLKSCSILLSFFLFPLRCTRDCAPCAFESVRLIFLFLLSLYGTLAFSTFVFPYSEANNITCFVSFLSSPPFFICFNGLHSIHSDIEGVVFNDFFLCCCFSFS
ncbi:hypothetical protein ABB37_05881 [Leptomonas pyrrhocoris]|uniref:Uncharacterized protein n=1 Tax=Leptomonas pyrrhocoris TaxID=157538 RepID=A0A0N0VEM6_LEPPY|nr:hypothetical protein ABB37_05881 [Leptomonas pyrrhocoris]KPA78778.1 hypothetical protein ABB37_05881 [Leptomonas pyrrhocoris]|eukprot:XP_015657217.1 hypothetical protein ABB37_05881 [Leptomonas pyrrhocoris]